MDKSQERRGGRRVSCFLEGTCEALEGTPPKLISSAVTVLNLSLTGANISTSRPLEQRTSFYLKLPNPARTFWCGRLTRVVHTRPLPPNHSYLGCEFSTPLSENELHTLLGHNPAPERRRYPRYMVSPETTEKLRARLVDFEGTVKIHDISLGGVSLLLSRQVVSGKRLEIDLSNSATGTRCALKLHALHVRPVASQWLVGCAFPEKLAAQDLLGLLS